MMETDERDLNDHYFEGVEKRLHLTFETITPESSSTLRSLPRSQWDAILSLAKCQIVQVFNLSLFDSYILSESSLFVYDAKVILKTCGTTQPLLAFDSIVSAALSVGLHLIEMTFSHKNFMAPSKQDSPMRNLDEEIDYLSSLSSSAPQGEIRLLGDPASDHWLVYTRTFRKSRIHKPLVSVDVLLFGIPPEVCQNFFKKKNLKMIDSVKRAIPDSFRSAAKGLEFDPCGFSCNSNDGERYLTVHVTPEEDFSFVSLEISDSSEAEIGELVNLAVNEFQPEKISVQIFGIDVPKLRIPGFDSSRFSQGTATSFFSQRKCFPERRDSYL